MDSTTHGLPVRRDGTWLVYQHAVNVLGYLVALPADDCLPIGSASAHAHLVGLTIVSLAPDVEPRWSLCRVRRRVRRDTGVRGHPRKLCRCAAGCSTASVAEREHGGMR